MPRPVLQSPPPPALGGPRALPTGSASSCLALMRGEGPLSQDQAYKSGWGGPSEGDAVLDLTLGLHIPVPPPLGAVSADRPGKPSATPGPSGQIGLAPKQEHGLLWKPSASFLPCPRSSSVDRSAPSPDPWTVQTPLTRRAGPVLSACLGLASPPPLPSDSAFCPHSSDVLLYGGCETLASSQVTRPHTFPVLFSTPCATLPNLPCLPPLASAHTGPLPGMPSSPQPWLHLPLCPGSGGREESPSLPPGLGGAE